MKRFLALALILVLALPLPALGVEELTPEDALSVLTSSPEYTVERRLEAANATIVLCWKTRYPELPDVRDYELYLIGRWEGPRMVRRLLLPSTALFLDSYAPTDRSPDSMFLSSDGSSLIYVYRFSDALSGPGGQVLHEAGTYTYQANLSTGELTVTHRPGTGDAGFSDVFSSDWFAPYVEVCVEEGLMKGTGDGFFAPYETLSGYECAMLALRLHDLGRGGDGTFEKAPWDWGYALLTLPDGTEREGYLNDGTAWGWTLLHRGDSGHLGLRLETEAEREWGQSMDYQTARLSINGAEYTGQLHLSGESFLYFNPANMDDYNAIQDARFSPTPNEWWRDAWYYAQQEGLTDILVPGNNERWDFALRMAAVTDLPPINEIPGLPDTGDPDTLELYRAGVLTGSDEYGTFHKYSTMTRAEAAAICARILRPQLRVSFSPKPLETYMEYTLTYLREDSLRVGGPYRPWCSLDLLAPDPHTLLRLDGTEVPIPQGYELAVVGDGLVGLIDYDGYRFGLMDSQGQLRQVPLRGDVFHVTRHWDGELLNGYQSGDYRSALYNEKGEQVTPAFDWVGFINAEGAGFVGMDRKIYRIQLKK